MGNFLLALPAFFKAIFVGAAAGATLFGSASAYVLAVNLARVGALALIAKLTAPKLDLAAIAVKKTITIRDPIAPQRFIYGEDMVSGPIIFANTAGDENRDLFLVIALTGHEIESVTSYRIDDRDIPLSELSGAEDGDATSGFYNGVLRVDLRKGTTTQVAIPNLTATFSTLFNAAHTGRGWSYFAWEFNLVEGSEDVYKNQPSNIRGVVKGYKVYDPRLDTTNGGSGLHRLADDTTWEWSHNPALCLAHFILDDKFGMREEDDRVDWPKVIAAANICDTSVSVPSTTQERYTCNVTFEATQQRRAVRDELLGSMMGRMVFSQGLWMMWAGAAITADVTLTEANLAGPIVLQASTAGTDRYNRVRGKYIDAAKDYTPTTYPEARSSTYVTEDGGEVLPVVADFMSTNSFFEAQRKSIITLKQSRNQRVVAFTGNLSCFRLQPGTTVDLDIAEYGFAGEKFFITEWKLADNGVELTLVEEVDSVWADPLVGDYATRSATGVLTFTDTGVPAPTALTATALADGVLLAWTNPLANTFQYIEIWRADENVRASAVLISTTPADTFFDATSNDAQIWYYWIRAVNLQGQFSAYEPDLTTTTATSRTLPNAFALITDPDFDKSTSLATTSSEGGYWREDTTDEGAPAGSVSSTVTLLPTGGKQGSAAVEMKRGDWPTSQAELRTQQRFRVSEGMQIAVAITYMHTTNSFPSKGINRAFINIQGYDAETGFGGVIGAASISVDLPQSFNVWRTESVVVDFTPITNPDVARFAEFHFQTNSQITADEADTFRIDSIYATVIEPTFGSQQLTTAGDNLPGAVPQAAAAAIAGGYVLHADGTWAQAGGYTQTNAESNAGVTPTDTSWPPGHILRYGAVRDSATDDGPAFQDAVDQALEVDGDPIILPNGDYHIETQTNIAGRDLRINASYGANLQWNGATDEHIFKIGDGGVTPTLGTIFDGLSLQDETSGSWLIQLDKADRSDFSNLYFFASTLRTAGGAVRNTDSTLVNWDNCRCNNLNAGIKLKPLVINGTGGNHFNGCRFENLNDVGIHWPTRPQTGTINCEVSGVAGAGGQFDRISAGSFLTDGFEEGDPVTGANFTSGGNNATFKCATVSATTIVVEDDTGMVNESGGGGNETLTGAGAGSFQVSINQCTFQGGFFTGVRMNWPGSMLSIARCYFEDQSWALDFDHTALQEYMVCVNKNFFTDNDQDAHIRHNGAGLTLRTDSNLFRNDPLVRQFRDGGKYFGINNESVAGDPGVLNEVYKSTITDMLSTNPLQVIEGVAHGLTTGDKVFIDGVVDSGPNGDFEDLVNSIEHTITTILTTSYSLDGVDGTAPTETYVSGGQAEWTDPHSHRFRIGGDGFLALDGSAGIKTRDGGILRPQTPWVSGIDGGGFALNNIDRLEIQADSVPGDTAVFTHGGVDFDLAFLNTVDWNIDALQALTGQVKIFTDTHFVSGAEVQIRDPGDTDTATFSHDGISFSTVFVGTDAWDITAMNAVTINREANAATTLYLGEPSTLRGDAQDSSLVLYGEQSSTIRTMSVSNSGANMGLNAGGGAVQIVSPTQITTGATLRILDSGNTDYGQFEHDGVDFNLTLVNTTDFNILGDHAAVKFLAGPSVEVYNSGNTDNIAFSHDGIDANITTLNAAQLNVAETGTVVKLPSASNVGVATTDHPFQIGSEAGINIRMDNNEILCVNNGGVETLNVQTDGGTVRLGFSTAAALYLANGSNFRAYGPNDTDYINIVHDNTDVNITHNGTVDWNISGITAIKAGTVDADFDALTATTYGGIGESNLLSAAGNETILGDWSHSNSAFAAFEINRISAAGGAGIKYSNNDGVKGYLGYDDNGGLNVWDSSIAIKARIDSVGSLFLKEQAGAPAHVSGFGCLWIKNTVPTELWFTDDAGTDTKIL